MSYIISLHHGNRRREDLCCDIFILLFYGQHEVWCLHYDFRRKYMIIASFSQLVRNFNEAMPMKPRGADSVESIQFRGPYNRLLKNEGSSFCWRIDQHTKRVQLAPTHNGNWLSWEARSFMHIFGKTNENDCVTAENIHNKYYLVANAPCPTARNSHAGKNDARIFREVFSRRHQFHVLQHVTSNKYVAKDDSDFLLLGNEEQALGFSQGDNKHPWVD